MRINHNIAALNTYNKLSANTTATSAALEKLSSGLKINKAGDNAAGLAISEKMRGQISGLDTAATNANDGISLIQTAEGALSETHSILQRMRELAVQASNDTNTDGDREEMQKEIDQLTSEVTRIATNTEFNTKKLLDGSMQVTTSNNASVLSASSTEAVVDGSYDVTISETKTLSGKVGGGTWTATAATNYTNVKAGTYTVTATGATTYTVADSNGNDVTTAFAEASLTLSGATAGADSITLTVAVSATAEDAGITDIQLSADAKAGAAITNAVTVDQDKATKFQIGANSGQNTRVSMNNMSAASLGVDAIDLTEQSTADSAITVIDNAIKAVSSERAKLGAMQNRLDHTINNLGTASENLTSAESQIRDVDMALEMTEFTKNNILSQAAQSMLAQANQQPQNVLQLLQ